MNRLTIVAGTAALLCANVARADTGETGETPLDPLDPVMIVSPLTIVQGDGVKIGEGTSFYPQVGLMTGFESNTFYQATNPIAAGTLQLIIEAGVGSLSAQRLANAALDTDTIAASDFLYEADAYVSYLQYISSNSAVTDQGGLGLGFHGNFTVHPKETVSFLANDDFNRVLRSADFETHGNENRDINSVWFRLAIHPETSALSGSLTYMNQIDVFEDNAIYPSRLLNALHARLDYAFLPLSTVYLDVSGGYNAGIGANDTKSSSIPVSANLGVSTALTVDTSLGAQAGYTAGFYDVGPSYQSVNGGAFFEYRYSPLSKLRVMYNYSYQDSINANFYHEHAFLAWLEQKVTPVALYVSPQLHLRTYEGVIGEMANPNRSDLIFAVAVGARYQFRNWISASAEYRFTDDSTDYRYTNGTMAPDPSYLRHEAFLGVRMAY
jgi:opacity protein-like surface antigen